MIITFTEEQKALREMVHALGRDLAITSVQGNGSEEASRRAALASTGLYGLALPEEYGGGDGSLVDVSIVIEEMGRFLDTSSILTSAVMAAHTLLWSDDGAQRARLLPWIANGVHDVALAWVEGDLRWNRTTGFQTHAIASDHGWRVTGHKAVVLGGATAETLLVAAQIDASAVGLFLVSGDAPGLTRCRLASLDESRELASIDLVSTPAVRLDHDDVPDLLTRVQELASVMLAAEQVGVAAAALEMAVAYAKQRVQFGQPIAKFQAIRHRCANMLVDLEAARSVVYFTVDALAANRETEEPAVAVARALASRAAVGITTDCIQIHGGIGFTWEHSAHRYYKRAVSNQVLLGTPSDAAREVGEWVSSTCM